MEIIRDLIPYELGGVSDLVFSADGLQCRLEIPEEWAEQRHAGMLSATEAAVAHSILIKIRQTLRALRGQKRPQ
jgi:hypothetical protein